MNELMLQIGMFQVTCIAQNCFLDSLWKYLPDIVQSFKQACIECFGRLDLDCIKGLQIINHQVHFILITVAVEKEIIHQSFMSPRFYYICYDQILK